MATLAVASYDSEIELEHAVKTLHRGGFDMTRVCVMGRDAARLPHVTGLLHSGRRAWFSGSSSALWTSLSAILAVASLVYVPVAEHVVILGWLATAMVPNLGGPSPLAKALGAVGVPPQASLRYEKAIAARKFLLIVQADAPGIRRLRELLERTQIATFPEKSKEPQ